MINETITVAQMIDFLNGALALDPAGVTALMACGAQTNEAMIPHPSIQVTEENGEYFIHPFGFFIGAFGFREDNFTAICYEIEPDGLITAFMRTPK